MYLALKDLFLGFLAKHPLYLVQTIFVPNLEMKFINRQDLFLENTEGMWS